MSIDLKFVELTADVHENLCKILEIFIFVYYYRPHAPLLKTCRYRLFRCGENGFRLAHRMVVTASRAELPHISRSSTSGVH